MLAPPRSQKSRNRVVSARGAAVAGAAASAECRGVSAVATVAMLKGSSAWRFWGAVGSKRAEGPVLAVLMVAAGSARLRYQRHSRRVQNPQHETSSTPGTIRTRELLDR